MKLQKDLAKLPTKVRKPRERKEKARVKGKNLQPYQRIPLRRRLQKPRVMGLTPKPRMFLLLSQSKKKTLLLKLSL